MHTCDMEPPTISIDCPGISRPRRPCVNIGRSDEQRTHDRGSGSGGLLDIFQRYPCSVTFATDRADDTFVPPATFGGDCDGGALYAFRESMHEPQW